MAERRERPRRNQAPSAPATPHDDKLRRNPGLNFCGTLFGARALAGRAATPVPPVPDAALISAPARCSSRTLVGAAFFGRPEFTITLFQLSWICAPQSAAEPARRRALASRNRNRKSHMANADYSPTHKRQPRAGIRLDAANRYGDRGAPGRHRPQRECRAGGQHHRGDPRLRADLRVLLRLTHRTSRLRLFIQKSTMRARCGSCTPGVPGCMAVLRCSTLTSPRTAHLENGSGAACAPFSFSGVPS